MQQRREPLGSRPNDQGGRSRLSVPRPPSNNVPNHSHHDPLKNPGWIGQVASWTLLLTSSFLRVYDSIGLFAAMGDFDGDDTGVLSMSMTGCGG